MNSRRGGVRSTERERVGTLFIESILLAQGLLLRARALLAFALRTIAALRVRSAP